MHTTSGGRVAWQSTSDGENSFSQWAAQQWGPLAARAQQPGKSPTIQFLGATTPTIWGPFVGAFLQRLRELGWIDGRDIAIEYRWARAG